MSTITIDADRLADLEEAVHSAHEAHRENTEMRDALLRIIASAFTDENAKHMAKNALRNCGMSELSIEGGVNARRKGAT